MVINAPVTGLAPLWPSESHFDSISRALYLLSDCDQLSHTSKDSPRISKPFQLIPSPDNQVMMVRCIQGVALNQIFLPSLNSFIFLRLMSTGILQPFPAIRSIKPRALLNSQVPTCWKPRLSKNLICLGVVKPDIFRLFNLSSNTLAFPEFSISSGKIPNFQVLQFVYQKLEPFPIQKRGHSLSNLLIE